MASCDVEFYYFDATASESIEKIRTDLLDIINKIIQDDSKQTCKSYTNFVCDKLQQYVRKE